MRLKKPIPPVCVAAAGVQVQAEPGRIRFDVSRLVESHGDAFLHRLLDRALRLETIQAISIDRSQNAITIEYDSGTSELGDTLFGIAGTLRGEQPARLPDIDVAVDFSGVVGSVTRVDRVHQLTGEMTPRAGRRSGFGGWFPRFARDKGAAHPSAVDAKSTRAVLHGLIVHYAPHSLPEYDRQRGLIEIPAVDLAEESSAVPGRCREGGITTGITKLANLAAAGGCFLLSIVGVVTPGIPTIPFVLATSYFLVRSTPELNERFRQSWLFGRLVRDWEDSGGLRRGTKVRAIAFMVILMGITLPTVTSLPLVGLTAAVATVDLWVVLRLPTIPEESEPKRLTWQPA
jgi:uncharacterized membrane protein YbaN (DUF454 family)